MQIAASRSTKAILREAKIVPEVAENCLPQARHFHLRRVGMPVGIGAAAGRAERLAAVLRKADRGERLERLVVGHAVHVAELEGPGGGGEEEVLRHVAKSVTFVTEMATSRLVVKGKRFDYAGIRYGKDARQWRRIGRPWLRASSRPS